MENKPELLNIKDLLSINSKYIIPLYQRNYAWTIVENTQLLSDIFDKFKEDNQSNYYIGTLVIDKRENNLLEIIDGQQRFTTISLINAVFYGLSKNKQELKRPNLYFESRTEIRAYLERLFSDYERAKLYSTEHLGLQNIIQAVKDIENYLQNKIQNNNNEKIAFEKYFLNQVKIIRVEVPKGTDINHYFEIMNNRGEQLEFHEILKAKFIESIELDNTLSNKDDIKKQFDIIWTACSQMNKHIQVCFTSKEDRKNIFGDNYEKIPEDYIKTLQNNDNSITTTKNPEDLLINIIPNYSVPNDFKQNSEQKIENKYESIIDFSNFLIQVLKIQNIDISLDDKKLLNEFGYVKSEDRPFPNAIKFINDLLLYRTLFDKYIIKREVGADDWSWCILSPKQNKEDGIYFVNTSFSEQSLSDEPEGVNKHFCMLQSMFHVSFPNKSYKNWLFDILKFLGSTRKKENTFLVKLIHLSKDFYKNTLIDNGVATERYIFNLLDYILWSEYEFDKMKNLKTKLANKILANKNMDDRYKNEIRDKIEKGFENFRFRQNNSVEHLHPQSKKEELQIFTDENDELFQHKNEILNCFGNLCLISRESNSKYNDYNFEAKREQFLKKNFVESLKQSLMYSYDKWNTEQIKEHRNEMMNLISKYVDNVE